jgi:Integral membrane protein TerC family
VSVSLWGWALFGILVLVALALDLGLIHGKRGEQRQLTLRAAAIRNGAWVALALLFGLGVLGMYGERAALTYLTAYLLEQSLSIDNVFVFVLIFSELKIPADRQRSVLLWGVLGAPPCWDCVRSTSSWPESSIASAFSELDSPPFSSFSARDSCWGMFSMSPRECRWV